MVKCDFRIKTRNGLVVDHIVIQAHNQESAKRRVKRMYHNCEILTTRINGEEEQSVDHHDLEFILTLIARQQG